GWADSLEYYEIFRNTEGGSFSLIDSLSPESISLTDTTIEAYVGYCYYVQANHKNGLISTSNMVCKYTEMPRIPGFINADYATISPENDEVSLSFTIDPASEIYHYKLLRANEPNGVYDTIADFTDQRSEKLTYTDTPEDLSSPFYYRLAAINACNRIIIKSNQASTMVLNVSNENAINYLVWTSYLEWKGGVEKYEVYRKTIENSYELIDAVDAYATSYTDNELDSLILETYDLKFCYFIKAVEGQDNPHGIRGISTTAVNCVVLQSKIFIPNAFTPNGDLKNDEWAPKLSFTPATYHLIIKNRWGNIIFESKDPYESWDGSYMGGAIVQEGTYIYFLSVITGTGKTIVRKGLINVIFP
ncbi:MAG: gliding motility-associated C-terminal domain-containing protein, partial [Bacteroidetes bacterium]|nr:gliding motility-associated C-terminal domain-containing protein [Bacteroidota bacterium]